MSQSRLFYSIELRCGGLDFLTAWFLVYPAYAFAYEMMDNCTQIPHAMSGADIGTCSTIMNLRHRRCYKLTREP